MTAYMLTSTCTCVCVSVCVRECTCPCVALRVGDLIRVCAYVTVYVQGRDSIYAWGSLHVQLHIHGCVWLGPCVGVHDSVPLCRGGAACPCPSFPGCPALGAHSCLRRCLPDWMISTQRHFPSDSLRSVWLWGTHLGRRSLCSQG